MLSPADRRRLGAAVSRAVGVLPPDRAPARRMRAGLAVLRRAGLPFDDAWDLATGFATHDLTAGERRSWSQALDITRTSWCKGYERTDVCAAFALLYAVEPEGADRREGALIA